MHLRFITHTVWLLISLQPIFATLHSSSLFWSTNNWGIFHWIVTENILSATFRGWSDKMLIYKQYTCNSQQKNCCVWHDFLLVAPESSHSDIHHLFGGFGVSAVVLFDLTSHSSELCCSSVSSWAQLNSTELSSPDVHIPPPLPDNLLPDLEWKNKHTPMKLH